MIDILLRDGLCIAKTADEIDEKQQFIQISDDEMTYHFCVKVKDLPDKAPFEKYDSWFDIVNIIIDDDEPYKEKLLQEAAKRDFEYFYFKANLCNAKFRQAQKFLTKGV